MIRSAFNYSPLVLPSRLQPSQCRRLSMYLNNGMETSERERLRREGRIKYNLIKRLWISMEKVCILARNFRNKSTCIYKEIFTNVNSHLICQHPYVQRAAEFCHSQCRSLLKLRESECKTILRYHKSLDLSEIPSHLF